jgi:[acyl-carrier-protein] S-malonyltransferase
MSAQMKNGAFLFPGQGVQYKGMGAKQYGESEIFRDIFAEASDVLGYDLWKICNAGTDEELADTEITQPAVFVTSVAFFERYRHFLPAPQYMAGHSLGEYTALTCAGAVPFRQALSVVQERGRLMKKAATGFSGAMISVNGIGCGLLEQICNELSGKEEQVSISAYNSQTQFVLSGHTAAIEKAAAKCTAAGGDVRRLKVSAPFHCRLMSAAAEELVAALNKIDFKTPSCRVLSNVTGMPYNNAAEIAEGLTMQMTHPVQWQKSMTSLSVRGIDFCVEAGPGKVLRNLLSNNSIKAFSLDDEKDTVQLREAIAENIGAINTLVTKGMGMAVSLKNHNFEPEAYEGGVVKPFRAIKKIQQQLELEKKLPGAEEIASCISLFCQILNTKLNSRAEKEEQLHQLLEESGSLQLLHFYSPMLNENII